MPRVLIVDDEPSIREVLRRRFEAAGYQTREASSPLEACRIFGEEERIDAVTLDLRMPGFSGFDFLEWLRSQPMAQSHAVPVFVLTGFALTETERATLRRFHAETFHKPHGVAEIIERLSLKCTPKGADVRASSTTKAAKG